MIEINPFCRIRQFLRHSSKISIERETSFVMHFREVYSLKKFPSKFFSLLKIYFHSKSFHAKTGTSLISLWPPILLCGQLIGCPFKRLENDDDDDDATISPGKTIIRSTRDGQKHFTKNIQKGEYTAEKNIQSIF